MFFHKYNYLHNKGKTITNSWREATRIVIVVVLERVLLVRMLLVVVRRRRRLMRRRHHVTVAAVVVAGRGGADVGLISVPRGGRGVRTALLLLLRQAAAAGGDDVAAVGADRHGDAADAERDAVGRVGEVGAGRRRPNVHVAQRLRHRPNVVVGEAQRLDLGQLGVLRESRQHAAQSLQRVVQHVHAVSFAVIGLDAPRPLQPHHLHRAASATLAAASRPLPPRRRLRALAQVGLGVRVAFVRQLERHRRVGAAVRRVAAVHAARHH